MVPGTILRSRYEIVSLIGKGGMSVVYLALMRPHGKDIVIKETAQGGKDGSKALEKEFSILSQLFHPHLPCVIDLFEEHSRVYLVEDYIKGKPLDATLKEIPPPDLVPLYRIIFQVCATLSYLHGKKILHRDLKPSNIILSEKGIAKLIDFGSARIVKKGKKADTVAFGTVGFASPEHYGCRQTDERSEVFSLGALCHYLFTRQNPSEKPFIFEDPAKINTALPEAVAALIRKATQLKRESRIGTISEFRHHLAGAAALSAGREKLLFCPLCWVVMDSLKAGSTSFEGCPLCRGIWCSTRELSRRGPFIYGENNPLIEEYWEETPVPKENHDFTMRRLCCPRCGTLMHTFHHRKAAHTELDRCPEGCGLWLDRGELKALFLPRGGKGL
ncbi:MAG: protein kinase [Candidatus Eremiobacteraeota bacterium]|nr:protein kinase [Candidatus Eremiobacteraeota bacterium]